MINTGFTSSGTCEWSTPQELFNRLHREWHFTLDVCATPENAKLERYFDLNCDGLKQSWADERCWMNPPYGRGIGSWVEKAWREVAEYRCPLVVCLLPSRTDTAWWHEYCTRGVVTFIRGRLRFGNSNENAPFPSAIVVFEKGKVKDELA